MNHHLIKFSLFLFLIIAFTNCSSDDNDCPDTLIVNINDPESLKRAEECGLSPAEPLGVNVMIYKK